MMIWNYWPKKTLPYWKDLISINYRQQKQQLIQQLVVLLILIVINQLGARAMFIWEIFAERSRFFILPIIILRLVENRKKNCVA